MMITFKGDKLFSDAFTMARAAGLNAMNAAQPTPMLIRDADIHGKPSPQWSQLCS